MKHRLLQQSDALHAIDHALYGKAHRRRRYLESHPLYLKEIELGNKYTYLYNSFSNGNSKSFLTHHMLLELQLLYNGHLHDVITNFVHFGYTAMTNLTSNSLKDPFKQPLSESMLNFLGRFCARIQRKYFFLLLTYKPKIGMKDTPLQREVMQHTHALFNLPRQLYHDLLDVENLQAHRDTFDTLPSRWLSFTSTR